MDISRARTRRTGTVEGMETALAVTAPLVLRDVAVGYDGVPVLAGVDFETGAGTIVGMLGPNGAGKSTLLRAAAGVEKALAGTICIAGVDASAHPIDARRHIGYLPDVGGLMPRLTVAEHLTLAERLWDCRDADRRRWVIERLDLGGFLDVRCAALSHGMSRRAGMAVALIGSPQVLVVDEPFDGVDPLASVGLREVLRAEADRGVAVICSTHLLDTAARLCDRIVVVANGTVRDLDDGDRQDGTTLEAAYARVALRQTGA